MDIENIRAETPGLAHVTHLLAAGSALMPTPVINAIKNHIDLEASLGGYEAQRRERSTLDAVYSSVAKLIGANPDEIAIVENATTAWCQAFYALPLKPGDRVLTSEAEYAANYVACLQRAKREGIQIDVIPSDREGVLDVGALEQMIDERTALIAITWVPTNGGLINPAEEVGKLARKHNVPYLLDACQAVGQMPVDVTRLGCDFLSATGRKFLRGPRGIGFLYARKEWLQQLEPPMIDHFAAPWVAVDAYELRPDARRFENWENAYALRAGLHAAATYALALRLDKIQQRAWSLADYLRRELATTAGAEVCDIGREKCAIVSFAMREKNPENVVEALRGQGICIGTSIPSSTRIDAERRKLPVLLRAAPHYYNTEDDIDRLLTALRALE